MNMNLKKIYFIIIIIICENLIFIYNKIKENLFILKISFIKDIKDIANIFLIIIIMLIIYIVSLYFSYITLLKAEEEKIKINTIKKNNLNNKYLFYIKKFFYIQGLTLFFIKTGIDFFLIIFKIIGNFFINILNI